MCLLNPSRDEVGCAICIAGCHGSSMDTLWFFLEVQAVESWEWLDLDMRVVGAMVSVDRKGEGVIAVLVRLGHVPAEGVAVDGYSQSWK